MLNSLVIPANHICRKNLLPWHEAVNVNMPEQPRITAEIREKAMKATPAVHGGCSPRAGPALDGRRIRAPAERSVRNAPFLNGPEGPAKAKELPIIRP